MSAAEPSLGGDDSVPAPDDPTRDATDPSTPEWLALDPGEEVTWRGHPRLTAVAPAALAGLAFAAVGVGLAYAVSLRLAPLALLGVVPPLWQYLVLVNTQFVVTDRALYRKTGVLSRRVERVGADRIQNSSLRQGVRGSLFDYGTVAVEAAGGGGLAFTDVRNPEAVRSLVDRRAAADDVPGDPAQWEAVLCEVRRWRRALESRGERRRGP